MSNKIENCEFRFDYICPLKWSNLKKTDEPNIKYCDKCSKLVYKCSSKRDYLKHSKKNHCIFVEIVSYDDDYFPPLMGKPKYKKRDNMS